MNCRYCNLPVADADAVIVHTYWNAQQSIAHKACRASGYAAEVLECQTIDSDCNDCRHFKRGELVKRMLSTMSDGKAEKIEVNMGYFTGHCLKFGKPTVAQPNKWTGHECFEHRRIK